MSEQDLSRAVNMLARPLADDLTVELVDVEVKGPRNRRLVRLVVAPLAPSPQPTGADTGLDVDRIAHLSRRVGDALDSTDLIPGSYTLEVSSPGADRPLRSAPDFRRNLGREVRVVRTPESAAAHDGVGEVTGTVVAVDESELTLDVDDADGVDLVVPLGDVDHGKVVLPW